MFQDSGSFFKLLVTGDGIYINTMVLKVLKKSDILFFLSINALRQGIFLYNMRNYKDDLKSLHPTIEMNVWRCFLPHCGATVAP